MNKLFIGLTAIIIIISSCETETEVDAPLYYCKITKITISSISERNGKGESWDSLDAPDIYLKMWGHGLGDYLDDSLNRLENNTTYPISLTLKKPFLCLEINWIGIMEYDLPWKNDNVLGAWDFRPMSYPNRPKIITLEVGQTSIDLEIYWCNH